MSSTADSPRSHAALGAGKVRQRVETGASSSPGRCPCMIAVGGFIRTTAWPEPFQWTTGKNAPYGGSSSARHVTAHYRTDNGPLDIEYGIEESAKLHERIESGPNWYRPHSYRDRAARRGGRIDDRRAERKPASGDVGGHANSPSRAILSSKCGTSSSSTTGTAIAAIGCQRIVPGYPGRDVVYSGWRSQRKGRRHTARLAENGRVRTDPMHWSRRTSGRCHLPPYRTRTAARCSGASLV
jgi:hypothetical protein